MLSGIRIVEFQGLGPGPFAGMLLAAHGAEVTLVQRAGGNGVPRGPGADLLDRGKRGIALDLKDPGDLALARRLVARSDGLIEGLRPGVMERLGLGPAEAQELNPALVYGRMTGWGQDGPLAQVAGHDLNYLALSGALAFDGQAGADGVQPPSPPPTLLGDIGGGALYLAFGMLAGLLNARATGRGTVVDAAILDGAAHMLTLLASVAGAGLGPAARGRTLLDGAYWSRCYACAGGGFISVQCLEPKFHALFLDRLGLADDPLFARPYDPVTWPAATERLARLFAGQPRDHWAQLFAGSDACVAPVLSPDEAARHPHVAARGVWQSQDGVAVAAPAPRFDGQVAQMTPAPGPDEHGAAIRADLAGDAPPDMSR